MPKAEEERTAKRSPAWQDKLNALTRQRQKIQSEGSPPFEPGAKTMDHQRMQSQERMHAEDLAFRREQLASQERQHQEQLTTQQRMQSEQLAFDRAIQERQYELAWMEFQAAAAAQEETTALDWAKHDLNVRAFEHEKQAQEDLYGGLFDGFDEALYGGTSETQPTTAGGRATAIDPGWGRQPGQREERKPSGQREERRLLR